MNIHWLQHVEFEGLGCIAPWLEENGHDVSCTRLWAGDELPPTCTIDGLIVMGGPMGVTDHAEFPWLAAEKAFIKEIIAHNKPVLGICLGAQFIADALGADVWPGRNKEIGFYVLTGDGAFFPKEFMAFHWHSDTFGIPDGAVRLASSEATENQAFLYKDNVLALQFHLETTEESLLQLYKNASDEITDAPFIQPLEAMRPFFPSSAGSGQATLGKCNDLMFELLGSLLR